MINIHGSLGNSNRQGQCSVISMHGNTQKKKQRIVMAFLFPKMWYCASVSLETNAKEHFIWINKSYGLRAKIMNGKKNWWFASLRQKAIDNLISFYCHLKNNELNKSKETRCIHAHVSLVSPKQPYKNDQVHYQTYNTSKAHNKDMQMIFIAIMCTAMPQ